MNFLDPLSEWSRLLFRAFVDAGIREVVVSPGSRSTPFVLAAAAQPGLRLHDIVDERSAAFFALGQARVTGRPSLLLCTSGTAGAHYLPALIEASQAYLPMLALTADRPLELQGCAAPQTIDQTKLFGEQVRAFVELGSPDAHPGALHGLRRKVAQAVHASLWPTPGPVHLNARAHKPLEPRVAGNDAEREFAERARDLSDSALPRAFRPRLLPSQEGLDSLGDALARARRPLFVAGPAPLAQGGAREAVEEVVSRAGGVLLAEATSQLRFGSRCSLGAFDAYLDLDHVAASLVPDLVIQLGGPPTFGAYARFLAKHTAERWVIAPHGWNDAESTATDLLVANPGDVAAALLPRLNAPPDGATDWQRRWREVNERARQILEGLVEKAGSLTEPAAVRAVIQSLASDDLLAVGNSLPIREIDLFDPTKIADCGVISQRGANGIDGLLSGAAGAATTGRGVTLLVGDISFLHDLGGLWAAKLAGGRLRVIVLQNRGGRIFEDLPLADSGVGDAMAHFTTPHEAKLEAAADIFGLTYRCPKSHTELARALEEPRDPLQASVIEVPVPRRSYSETRASLRAAIVESLSRSFP